MASKPTKKASGPANNPYFVTWDEKDVNSRALAFAQATNALGDNNHPVVRTQASSVYRNIGGNNISVRDGVNRSDFDYLRHNEALPKTIAQAIRRCSLAYDEHGIIRNVIDMMSDFTIQGVTLYHPNEKIEAFYRAWWKKIRGTERSERFVNLLFRQANVIVQRATAKVNAAKEKQMRAEGADIDFPEEPEVVRREIPMRYTFLNPLSLSIMSEPLISMIGIEGYLYQVAIPAQIKTAVQRKKKSADEERIIGLLPDGLLQAIANGQNKMTLDPKKIRSFFYRKDDWDVWAKPMLTPILKDLDIIEKMKLADRAALDGAISCIRVWKLGSMEHKIMPTPAGIARLSEMLMNNVGGGVMDLVWGPELELIETSTEVHRFLGEGKYAPHLAAVFAGLGVPPTLVGSGTTGGFTNNAISLKTLIERMEYAREVLVELWTEEIRIVQRAMGFRFPASIGFDRMTLMDESQEQALQIQLLDRMGVSVETIQELFGLNPEIENIRLKREERKRTAGQVPRKAGPFHSDNEHELKKIVAGGGTITPSQMGLDLPEAKPGEQSPAEIQNKLATKLAKAKPATPAPGGARRPASKAKPKGRPGQGRPANKKDSTKRKKKVVRPRTSANEVFMESFAWAERAQAVIADLTSPAYLKSLNKKTMRELTTEQAKAFESFKFHLLLNIQPGEKIEQERVEALVKEPLTIPEPCVQLLNATIAKYVEANGTQPSTEMIRRYQSGVYACWQGEFEDEEEASDIGDGLS